MPLSLCCSLTVLHFFHILTTGGEGFQSRQAAGQSRVSAFINRGGTTGGWWGRKGGRFVSGPHPRPALNVWVESVSDLRKPPKNTNTGPQTRHPELNGTCPPLSCIYNDNNNEYNIIRHISGALTALLRYSNQTAAAAGLNFSF